MLIMNESGGIIANQRRDQADKTIATAMVGLSLNGGWEAYSSRGIRVNQGTSTLIDLRAFPPGPYWIRVGNA